MQITSLSPLEKCPYSESFWSVFSHIGTDWGETLLFSLYLVGMRENMDQKNPEYGHFLRRAYVLVQII